MQPVMDHHVAVQYEYKQSSLHHSAPQWQHYFQIYDQTKFHMVKVELCFVL